MKSSYFTVKKTSTHEIIIQKSRFIGFVYRVSTEKEVQSIIQKVKKQHHQANHHCYAFVIGEHNEIQKANDDGEPGGTAGMPILNVLKNHDLKNTLVIVTRYFGGTKLGAGGLIRAYSKSTSLAIQSAGIVKCQRMERCSITINYTLFGKIENHLVNSEYLIENIQYSENVTMIVLVKVNDVERFTNEIINMTSNQMTMHKLGETFYEKDMSL